MLSYPSKEVTGSLAASAILLLVTRSDSVNSPNAQIAAKNQDATREAFLMMHQACDVLLNSVTDEFKTQKVVALRSEALRLAAVGETRLAARIRHYNDALNEIIGASSLPEAKRLARRALDDVVLVR